jgi:hypothetical protein
LRELQDLSERFTAHTDTFKDWLRTGGPINPLWMRDTISLRKDLHRTQCRAARRIYVSDQAATSSTDAVRCLGAVIVNRALRRVREQRNHQPAWQQTAADVEPPPKGKERSRRGSLETIIPVCNTIGHFERLGETDLAFICDFCDGFLVWPNLQSLPAERKFPGSLTLEGYPSWAASGLSYREKEEKDVVFAPLAIANHLPLRKGEWIARTVCPFCEEYTYFDQGDGDGERRLGTDGERIEGVEELAAHLGWTHTALPRPDSIGLAGLGKGDCEVM